MGTYRATQRRMGSGPGLWGFTFGHVDAEGAVWDVGSGEGDGDAVGAGQGGPIGAAEGAVPAVLQCHLHGVTASRGVLQHHPDVTRTRA